MDAQVHQSPTFKRQRVLYSRQKKKRRCSALIKDLYHKNSSAYFIREIKAKVSETLSIKPFGEEYLRIRCFQKKGPLKIKLKVLDDEEEETQITESSPLEKD